MDNYPLVGIILLRRSKEDHCIFERRGNYVWRVRAEDKLVVLTDCLKRTNKFCRKFRMQMQLGLIKKYYAMRGLPENKIKGDVEDFPLARAKCVYIEGFVVQTISKGLVLDIRVFEHLRREKLMEGIAKRYKGVREVQIHGSMPLAFERYRAAGDSGLLALEFLK